MIARRDRHVQSRHGIRRSHPYSGLTPDVVLNALDGVGLRCDGTLLALNSYENRVYQVGIDDAAAAGGQVLPAGRWSDAAILEEHAFVAELAEREIPVVAPLALAGATLHAGGGFRFAVFPRRGGRAPELDRPETLEWMGRFLGRIHAVGALAPFRERPPGHRQLRRAFARFSAGTRFLPADLRPAWQSVVEQALDGVRRCYARAGAVAAIRLHGDCHAGNVLWTDAGPHFVDFDDCRMGPARAGPVDAAVRRARRDDAPARRRAGRLRGFLRVRPRELHLVEALRTLRLLHYSAWLARRWDDPAFPAAFPWFNTQRYWQDRILELREQVALMDEPPLPA
jgi:Ser/Thr protein kinase RdoA (MazF antagonist)